MTSTLRVRVRRVVATTTVLLLAVVGAAWAHDLFIKPDQFFVAENSRVLVRVLNGTFSKSENSIARNRLLDVSIVSPTGRFRMDTSSWNATGDTSTFELRTLGAGTYVLGVSTRPNVIALKAADFNAYLREDGIPDVLAERERTGQLDRPARELYHKHVKALVQVGNIRSTTFETVLGYPAEIVPLQNPYELSSGKTLRVRALVDGRPAANQLVVYGGRTTSGLMIERRDGRTDENGIVRVPLRRPGTWYIEFIHMKPVVCDTVDYESKWATHTFQVR
jgi:uncharacterized GH25 family protein